MRAPLFVVALATASAFAQPARDFVSTRATAAKLGGLPGRPCAPADARGIKGPCWDPPGYERAVPMPTLSSGKRLVAAPNWKERAPHAIYWFDIPREATAGHEGDPTLVNGAGENLRYEPYAPEGFARPALPPLVGKSVDEALAAIDALDMPFSVYFKFAECKNVEHDRICDARGPLEGIDVNLRFNVSQRIRYRGLPEEERILPEPDTLIDRPTDEVVAQLKKLGFTNIQVLEKDLPCKRGIVCQMPGHAGWRRSDKPIELWVRKAPPT